MNFTLANQTIQADFFLEKSALFGVQRIVKAVSRDIRRVTKKTPQTKDISELNGSGIVVLTLGASELAKKLQEKGHFQGMDGLREVYEIKMLDATELGASMEGTCLVICGSDKRGTIYGLFHLSEELGVNPWVDWADVPVKVRETVVLDESIETRSKEPSVRYRGFFINDEWPSFGNWTEERNGGFNAHCYERVFELLLRLKGNYLWPAMWSASFPLDGPGLANEELADELGVVISFSHHEPCMRASEEWDKVRGEGTIYGNEWNFYTNREGLLRYWSDGLARSGHFDNIITIGMRGERDSSMLGPDATLGQNIDLLKDIIHEQRRLIAEQVNPKVSEVPQMLALYKEVEAYFYGDSETPGLQGWEELDDVTLLLCEDNYGNMRTLPTEEMRKHPGGYGMYYHFDYHGGPISYEWVNSTPLTKVWEQMTQAYEYGIRDIWVVNVGDLKPQELPLSYFLDLAYDYDRYGIAHPNETDAYVEHFAEKCFGSFIKEEPDHGYVAKVSDEEPKKAILREIRDVLLGYTWANGVRRPETINRTIFHPVREQQAGKMLALAEKLTNLCEHAAEFIEPLAKAAYFELVYYPAIASMNVLRMQIYAGLNSWYLKQGDARADRYATLVGDCIAKDWTLIDCYHRVHGSKWIHMMSSKHIGFVSWNDEGSDVPKVYTLRAFRELSEEERAKVCVFKEEEPGEAELSAEAPNYLGLTEEERKALPTVHVVGSSGVSFDAVSYDKKSEGDSSWTMLSGYGKTCNAVKVLPVGKHFAAGEGPTVEYRVVASEAGNYNLSVHMAPSNPAKLGAEMCYGVQVNDGEVAVINSIPSDYKAGDCFNWRWCKHVLENERISTSSISLPAGESVLRIYAIDPEIVLQRLDLAPIK